MKLKLIAAAAALAASGVANAYIDNGAGGNGELFFSVWDGVSSYTRDLNITIDGFATLIANPGSLNLTFAADQTFLDYLGEAGRSLTELRWAISAVDNQGAKRLIETYTTLPTTPKTDDVTRSMAGAMVGHIGTTSGLNSKLASSDSAIYLFGTQGYANVPAYGATSNDRLGFRRTGTAINASYADGLGLVRIDARATLVAASTYTPYVDDGFAVRAYLDLSPGDATFGQLTIAAVPEPESYAMLLAGLGVMGAIARRRSRG